jgi:hypothetical protein
MTNTAHIKTLRLTFAKNVVMLRMLICRSIAYNLLIDALQNIAPMETPTKTTNGEKLEKFIYEKFDKNELSNDDLVQVIELCGMLLNVQTIPDYAKQNSMSYNGVKKGRQITKIFNVKFVIDNL